MGILSLEKSKNGCKSIFHEYDKKNNKKVLVCSKVQFLDFFKHTKTFFGKMFC